MTYSKFIFIYAGMILIVANSCQNGIKQGEKPINRIEDSDVVQRHTADSELAALTNRMVVKYHLNEMIEDAKWRMYAMYCDSVAYFKDIDTANQLFKGLKYGELDFKIRINDMAMTSGHDSVNIEIYFMIGKYYLNDFKMIREKGIDKFCGFNYNTANPAKPIEINFCSGNSISLLQNDHHSPENIIRRNKIRVLNPMQPEVIYYIRENAGKINRWFYSEAIKRGVFDSTKYPPAKILEEITANKKEKYVPLVESIEFDYNPAKNK